VIRLHASRRQHLRREPLGVAAHALDFDEIAGPEVLEPGFVEGAHGSGVCSLSVLKIMRTRVSALVKQAI
jgi:hypothetical protein